MNAARFLGLALLGIIAGMVPIAKAAVVLDQQYLASFGGADRFSDGSGFRRAQTFTVGIAGTLSEIDIFLIDNTTFTGFNVLDTSAGVPTTVLTTGTLLSSSSTEAAFTISLQVMVGQMLAFEPITSTAPFTWRANPTPTYTGGGDFIIYPSFGLDTFTMTSADNDFQTFVTTTEAIPEPASLMLLGTALAGMAALRRKPG